MSVRLPGLLDASLSEVARLHPTAGGVTLKMIGSSDATMTLPEDAPAMNIHDWVSIYTQRGLAGIFRVSNVSQNYSKQIDLALLHGIDILSDSVWAAQMDFTGTKAQFITQLLNQQTHLINGVKPWVLDVCEDEGNYEKTINYDRLSTLLEDLEEEGGGYYFVYDQSSFPWRLSYVAKDNAADSEFRLTRNVRSATVTYNDADLCTRLHLSVSVKSKDADTDVTSTDTAVRTYDNLEAQARWGIVVKTADIDTKDDIEEQHFANADAWAQNFLTLRAEPSVQIQIDGDELAQLTGDSWDELSIGKMCQVALPAYGHTFLERVVSITYPEFLKDPGRVTVSLANTLPKFSENIASAQKAAAAAGASARGAARGAADAKELTTWSQHVKYQGAALDGTGITTLYESGIDMDATGGVKIFSLVEGVQALYADIQVNANQISSIVQKSGINDLGQNETLYTRITQTESDITSLANKTGVNSLGQNETLFSRITQNATAISQEIGRATGAEESIGSRVTQTETDITSLVQKTGVNSLGQNETLYSKVTQNADSITSVVNKTGVNSLGQNETLYSKITQESGRIDLVVSGSGQSASIRIGSIVDGINSSAVQIDAAKIYLNGQAIANSISAVSGEINDLKTGVTKATLINADSVVADNLAGGTVSGTSVSIGSGTSGGSGTLYYRGSQYYRQGITLGGSGSIAEGHFLGDSSTTMNLDHYHKIVATEGTGSDAGKIIISLSEPVATSDTTNSRTNFNIAATTAYQNGVLAARNAVKVNPFTANQITGATPDHRTFTYTTDAPTPDSGTSQSDTWYLSGGTSWNNNKTSVGLHYGSAGGTTYALLEVDASSVATAANRSGRAAVTLLDPTADARTTLNSSRTFTVSTSGRQNSSGAADELSKQVPLHLYAGSFSNKKAIVYLKWGATAGSSGTNYAQTEVDASGVYEDGWGDAYGTVEISPSSSQTLAPGGSVIVYAKAKATSDASSKTNVASVKITAQNVSASIDSIVKNGSATYSANYKTVYIPVKASGTNVADATGTISCDVSDAWNAGAASVTPESHVVQANRRATYTSNGTKYLYPGTGFDVMEMATISVDVDAEVSKSDISISALATSSSPYSCDVTRSMSAAYKYAKLTVTVLGVSKTVAINISGT